MESPEITASVFSPESDIDVPLPAASLISAKSNPPELTSFLPFSTAADNFSFM
jgi:hypothetical protein